MKKIEINGLGVYVEVWNRKEDLTDLETIREAIKTLSRELLRREQNERAINNGVNRTSSSD